jgi:DNA-binding response OmpR family regulator
MNTDTGRVLIVDDEVNIRAGLRDVLAKDGYVVKEARGGAEALTTLETFECDAAIVDIRMPDMSGIELLEKIRARWPSIAVIMLTGHGTMETAMVAVKKGAHDYLLKPARSEAIRESMATAVAASRRRVAEAHLLESLRVGLSRLEDPAAVHAAETPSSVEARQLLVGDLHIDLGSHEVRRDGALVHLSPSEFKLLVTLASRPGEAVDYSTLVESGLGYEAELWEAKELVKRHIFAMRHKIEPDPTAPRYILNVRGVGYRLSAPN